MGARPTPPLPAGPRCPCRASRCLPPASRVPPVPVGGCQHHPRPVVLHHPLPSDRRPLRCMAGSARPEGPVTRTEAGMRARVAAAASAASAGAATNGCRAPGTTAESVAAETTGTATRGSSNMAGQRPRSTTPPPVPGGAAAVATAEKMFGVGASAAVARAAGRGGRGSAGRGPVSAGRGAPAASSAASGGRSRSELAENLLRTATWAQVPDRDHLRPTPRQPRTLPLGLRDPVPNKVVLPPRSAPARLPVGAPIEVADACDVDGEGPWPTVRVASGGAMPGPGDTAAIDEA